MFDERILRVATDGGTSVLVGSADSNAVPACCRGIAVSTDHTLGRATVYVPVATSRDVIANAATTKKLAVMITRVVEHVGVQLKGTVEAIRMASDDEEVFVRRRFNERGSFSTRPAAISTRTLSRAPRSMIRSRFSHIVCT